LWANEKPPLQFLSTRLQPVLSTSAPIFIPIYYLQHPGFPTVERLFSQVLTAPNRLAKPAEAPPDHRFQVKLLVFNLTFPAPQLSKSQHPRVAKQFPASSGWCPSFFSLLKVQIPSGSHSFSFARRSAFVSCLPTCLRTCLPTTYLPTDLPSFRPLDLHAYPPPAFLRISVLSCHACTCAPAICPPTSFLPFIVSTHLPTFAPRR
jgi:hypothetical protein